MAYITPIRGASSVRLALTLKFLKSDEDCLIIAKSNRLEIYNIVPDGLVLLSSHAIYGRATVLHKLWPKSSETEHLFVGTDRSMYFTLSWNPSAGQINTERSYYDLADRSVRASQTGDRCQVDPKGHMMILEIFEGVLTVIPLLQKHKKKSVEVDEGNLGEPITIRIAELFIRSSTFLNSYHPNSSGSKNENARIALLHEDNRSKMQLLVKDLGPVKGVPDTYDIENDEVLRVEVDAGATHLIPLSAPAQGVIILGELFISYSNCDDKHLLTEPLPNPTIFVAWTQIDTQRFILADEYGKLYLLMLDIDSDDFLVQNFHWGLLGTVSRASVLVYLGKDLVFLGSHQGDSQLLKLSEGSLDVIQSFQNIAPILDFTIMDMGNRLGEGQMNEFSSGQARIVCGSGAFQDGSLRSIRSGVGLESLGILDEMEHIVDLFSLKSSASTSKVDTLAVSFISETRIFRFGTDGDVEEVNEFAGMQLSDNTLQVTNLSRGRLLQIISSSVRLLDLENGMVVSEWSPGGALSISDAAVKEDSILLSVGGLQLVSLRISDILEKKAEKVFGEKKQISCIHISDTTSVGFVGFWQTSTVEIFGLNNLKELHRETISDTSSVPRSILLTQLFESKNPTLIIALADGHIITYAYNTSSFTFSQKKTTTLGTRQAHLKSIPLDNGLSTVVAACDHPSIIYGSDDRIVYSAVTAEDASCVCPFDSEQYPGSIAVASSNDLRIASIDTERTTHVQTLSVSETVRRIAYSPELKAFGLGTIKRSLEGNEERVESHFKLVDEVMFNELDTLALNIDELVVSVICTQLDGGDGSLEERFIIGTEYLSDEEENIRGRLIIIEVTEDRQLKMVTQLSVRGACRCLGVMDDKIVAALAKTVVVYSFSYPTKSSPRMEKLVSFRTSTMPIDIAINGNRIAIADLMKSISVIEYNKGEDGGTHTLKEIARHLSSVWGTAVAEVDNGTYLESDAEGNLLVLSRDFQGLTEADRKKLSITSHMCLGEMVNRVRCVDVQVLADAPVTPKAYMATVEGSIYLFSLIHPSKQDLLMTFQSQLAALVDAPGKMSFEKFRAFKNLVWEADEPYRFVDGELVERYLDCSPKIQNEAIEGLSVTVDDMKALVERLRRMH